MPARKLLSSTRVVHDASQWRYMKKREPIPEIATVVRRWMPDASDAELKEATINLRCYLAVVYRIFLRLEAEGKLPEPRDNFRKDDTVNS
jgi:hypothetical protein